MTAKKVFQFDLPGITPKEQRLLANLCGTDICDSATAGLKLDFLKENPGYQQFYREFKQNPDAFLSIRPIPRWDDLTAKHSVKIEDMPPPEPLDPNVLRNT